MTFEYLQKQWIGGSAVVETYTSGSTGTPRLIQLPRQVVKDSAWRTIRAFNLTRDSWLHSCISPDTIGGKMLCIRAIELGARFTYEPPSNTPLEWFGPSDWLSLVSVVPSQVSHILDRLEARTLPLIENLLIGGSPLPPALRTRIAASPLNAYESYGMTETASHIAVRRVTEADSSFMPLPGVEVALTDTGCLKIILPGQAPLETNDLASISPEGFRILGRYDNVIISGGKKIIPEELEAFLSSQGCQTIVSSIPDDKWGERVVAVTTSPSEILQLQIAIGTIEEHWRRPKEIIVTDHIPLTQGGKIDRVTLRESLKPQ